MGASTLPQNPFNPWKPREKAELLYLETERKKKKKKACKNRKKLINSVQNGAF